jgi:hypothetical protein
MQYVMCTLHELSDEYCKPAMAQHTVKLFQMRTARFVASGISTGIMFAE